MGGEDLWLIHGWEKLIGGSYLLELRLLTCIRWSAASVTLLPVLFGHDLRQRGFYIELFGD
jgi:hypothetical protein